MRHAVAVCLLVAASGAGCVRVRPYQRQRLASPAMQAPVWPALDRADHHTREVREGTGGATGEAGTSCGCN
ncbi:MAG: DUF4266 domain-containing protein [Kofleriaceae bacterium]|nr:DUF4266 domain-containing protein [Myxococcales bacterium]MCB9572018.1 DUF4266 domain-containing protein [Kofleriaceae bacterium]